MLQEQAHPPEYSIPLWMIELAAITWMAFAHFAVLWGILYWLRRRGREDE